MAVGGEADDAVVAAEARLSARTAAATSAREATTGSGAMSRTSLAARTMSGRVRMCRGAFGAVASFSAVHTDGEDEGAVDGDADGDEEVEETEEEEEEEEKVLVFTALGLPAAAVAAVARAAMGSIKYSPSSGIRGW